MRIRFLKRGGQRKFLDEVILKLRATSLRGLLQFGFDVKYSTLKNYYNEDRLMPKELVLDFCEVAGLEFGSLVLGGHDSGEPDFELVDENWGKVKGGRISKR
ncbi:hypothetical protein HNV12_00135 [Methanococcoides sp. SA1]|nr:hypothetical protein [Methanococcoides sp. SA1]